MRILLFPFVLSSFSLFAASSDNTTQLDLGIYTSSITYTEPSVMQEKGTLLGFMGRVSSRDQGEFFAFEAAYSSGDMDYEGSGTITGIPDEMLEIRGLVGGDLKLGSNFRITPYIGLGYRNLNDDSSGMVSSTSRYGYEREQVYIYSPIGIEFKRGSLLYGWRLTGRIEFDYLLEGRNHSYTGVASGHNDVSFTQSEGYGNRVSVGFSRVFDETLSLTIEPFYKHWDISESTVDYDGNEPKVEPYNYSKEFGVTFLITL